jgi:glycosyltransferase involved in cell wall biosynthesis
MGFWRGPHHVWAYRLLNRWVTKIVVVSESIKKMVMETEAVAPERIEVVYNGIDLKEFSGAADWTIKKELGIKEDEKVIMHVANLKPIKGHGFLFQALAAIGKIGPKFKLVLIGKDEFNGRLQSLAKDLNISDKIIFLGKRTDVARLLPAADICVLPSLSEGMSNAILEYMLAGKPVVATNVGGNPELVREGFNGLLVEPKNAQQLEKALLSFLQDENKRRTMGQNALRLVQEEFSIDQMVRNYENLFSGYKNSRRLLHLVSSGGLYGAENVILHLASSANGLFPYVGALNNRHNPHLEVIAKAKAMGVKTVVFDSQGRFDLGTVFKIRDFLLENNIDIIHTHNYKSDIVGFLAAKLAGKKWIATNHVWHSTDSKLKIYETIDAFILKQATKVVAVSEEIRQDLLARHFASGHVRTIHNGINIAQFLRRNSSAVHSLRKELGIKENELVLSIVGRLSKEKGHAIFIEAAQEVLKQNNNIKFLIIGDGPLRESLRAEVEKRKLTEKIIFTGIRQDMPEVYSMTDVLVNASFIEGLPMTILEAMAAQLPIIATKVGAIPQVIRHKENGLLLDAGDKETLVKAMRSLIDDAQMRNHLAQQAYRDVCEHFSVERMSEQYKQVYQEILN